MESITTYFQKITEKVIDAYVCWLFKAFYLTYKRVRK